MKKGIHDLQKFLLKHLRPSHHLSSGVSSRQLRLKRRWVIRKLLRDQGSERDVEEAGAEAGEKAGAVEKETLLHRMGLGREAIVTKVMVRSNLMENQKGPSQPTKRTT